MRAYSTDLHEKLVLAYETGEGPLDEVADTFAVGRCTVARMMKLWRAGQSRAPLPYGGGYPATLDEQLLALLRKQVAVQPDATLAELTTWLKRKAKARVPPANICGALQKLDLPRKKSSRIPRRGRAKPRRKRPRQKSAAAASPTGKRRSSPTGSAKPAAKPPSKSTSLTASAHSGTSFPQCEH